MASNDGWAKKPIFREESLPSISAGDWAERQTEEAATKASAAVFAEIFSDIFIRCLQVGKVIEVATAQLIVMPRQGGLLAVKQAPE